MVLSWPSKSCTCLAVQADGAEITTIEGLDENGNHPVQEAWRNLRVPQCGYCQSGMIMAAAAFLAETPEPDAETVRASITNLCRCGTYPRIERAILKAAEAMRAP